MLLTRLKINRFSKQRKTALTWLYGFLVSHKRQILLLAFFSLLTTALVIFVPYLSMLIIDKGLLKKDFNALVIFSCLLFFTGMLSTLLAGYNRIKHTQLSGNILFAIREDVFQHLQKLPSTFFHQQRVGDISSRMDRDIAEIQRFAVDTLFSSFSAILGLTAATAMMIHLHWQLSLILLILIPFELFYLFKMRPKVQRKNIQVRESAADISAFFAEKIPVIKFIQSAGGEKQELDKLGKLNHTFLGKLISLQKTEFWTSAIPSTLVSLSRAAIFLIGGYWVIQGSFSLGSLIAFTAYVAMAIGPLQSLLGLYLAWQRLTVSLDRVSFIRQQTLPANMSQESMFQESMAQENISQDGLPLQELPQQLKGDINITNLCFSHALSSKKTKAAKQTALPPIFKQVNVHIPAGSKVGIVGQTGIGKSTLVDLLQCHLLPDAGTIDIDGIDLAKVNVQNWRQRIAIAPQDPVIFRDTLANNIRYGYRHQNEVMKGDVKKAEVYEADIDKAGVDESGVDQNIQDNTELSLDEKIYNAAISAGLASLIAKLPFGINTIISERGTALSGGEKQRIGLARVLMKNPILVILDEPTSATDKTTESEIIAQVDQLFANTTRLIVSHSGKPIADADMLIEITSSDVQVLKGEQALNGEQEKTGQDHA